MCRTRRDRPAVKAQYRDETENKRGRGSHKHMDPYHRIKFNTRNYNEFEEDVSY